MHAFSEKLLLTDPEQTCRMAGRLAPVLRTGDVVLLSGDVGAGKTHFARCVIQSQMDIPEDVPSPTFTLVQTYPARNAEIWHADLYRLSDVNDVFELGLIDAFENAICLIEWPDRLGDLTPASALHLEMQTLEDPDHREATFRWTDPVWNDRMSGVFDV